MIREYLDELTRRLQAQLGDRLVAAWQVGSGALGDFDQLRSDIDVQALSAPLERAELEALAATLTDVPCPVRGLEFVLYAEPPRFALNLNTGPGMTHHEGYDPDAEERFWFVLDVAIARANAVPLAGPHPGAVLPELPRSLLLTAHVSRSRGGASTTPRRRSWRRAARGRGRSKGASSPRARRRRGRARGSTTRRRSRRRWRSAWTPPRPGRRPTTWPRSSTTSTGCSRV